MTSEFKTNVEKFIELDDHLKGVASEMKPLRKEHKDLKAVIMNNMDSNDIGRCNILEGEEHLTVNYRDTKIKPKKVDILKKMSEFLRNKEKAVECYDFVYENCETHSAMSLSRKTNKGKKRKLDE